MKVKSLIFLIFGLVFSRVLTAQDQFGLAQSNYSPSTSVFHNPSSIVDSKVYFDIHLYGNGLFIHNNYMFLPAKEFSSINAVLKQELPLVSYDNSRKDYNVYSSLDIQFLSATFQYKEHGFAYTSRTRGFVAVNHLPKTLAYFIDLEELPGVEKDFDLTTIGKVQSAKNFHFSSLLYYEHAFSYAKAVYHRDRNLVILGGSVKYLLGLSGGGLAIDEMDYSIDSTGSFNYSNFDVVAGNSDIDLNGDLKSFYRGSGFSCDFGFTYKKMLYNVTNYDPFPKRIGRQPYAYKWKIGASLIDIGSINFKYNTSITNLSGGSGNISESQFSDLIFTSQNFLNTEIPLNSGIKTDSAFTMFIPLAFVLQYDYNTEKNFYFSTQYTHGFKGRSSLGIQRPNVFTFTSRYETRWFELAFPIAIYDFQEARTGIMIRIGGISFGTDKLGTYLSLTNATGYDFYFHMNYKLYKKKAGNASFSKKHSKYMRPTKK